MLPQSSFRYRGPYFSSDWYPEEHAKFRLVWQQAHEKEKVDVTFFCPFTLLAFMRMDILYDFSGRSLQASPQSAAHHLMFPC